jgi:NAD/NADP transhydrogenase beta subunit
MIGTEMNWMLIAIGLIIGSIIGAFFAIKVQMTQMLLHQNH